MPDNCFKAYLDALDDYDNGKHNLRKEIGKDLIKIYAEEFYLIEDDMLEFSFDEGGVSFYVYDLDIQVAVNENSYTIFFDLDRSFLHIKQIDVCKDTKTVFKVNSRIVSLDVFISNISEKQREWIIKRMNLLDNNC